jgi:hypothetical protein
MLQRFRASSGLGKRKRKFRFKNKLLSLDSTTISLCLNLFPWAKFRRAKGGVKVHVLLDHDDYMPSFALISEAKRHDRTVAKRFQLKPGSIVAFDRAYNDYKLFSQWTENGIFFVTRQKENAVFQVMEAKIVPQNRKILADQMIRLTGPQGRRKMPPSSSPCSRLGSRQASGDRSSDQSSGVRFEHYRRHLQRQVGDRDLLQDPETAPEGQDFYRHQRKCFTYSDLDSLYRFAPLKVFAPFIKILLVDVQPFDNAQTQSLYIS